MTHNSEPTVSVVTHDRRLWLLEESTAKYPKTLSHLFRYTASACLKERVFVKASAMASTNYKPGNNIPVCFW